MLMIKRYLFSFCKAFFLLCCGVVIHTKTLTAQGIPELMYYKFDTPGSQSNIASAPVGNNPSTVNGTLSIGGTGQFGAALSGTGASSTSYVDNGWATNLVSTDFTISFWINNIPSGSTLYYLWGDPGNSMRCFVNGAPGSGNMRFVGTGLPNVDVTDVTSGPTHITYVRTLSPNQVTTYKNGVQVGTFNITGTLTTGTGFRIGTYNTTGLNGLMDEFRMYNRALSAAEVSQVWNQELPSGTCTAPPVPGAARALPDSICLGSAVSLSVSGASFGNGQTYQWQSATSEAGTYTAIGTASTASGISVSPTVSTWYRVAVTCSGQTTYSTPVRVYIRPSFTGGTYTINATLPTGGLNFNSFTAAISSLTCSINGPVVFNVANTATPYNEQIIIPAVGGTSDTNTITINGNGATLQYASTSTDARAVIKLDGADYIRIKNLNINSTTGTYGWGIHLTNGADNDSITNCTITLDATGTNSNFAGIVASASNTSALSAGNNTNNLVIANNTINGGYYGITNYGTSSAPFVSNNKILNNVVNDFYYYGIYLYGNLAANVSGNTIQRLTRSTLSTTYALYLGSYCSSLQVLGNRIWKLFEQATTSTGTTYCIYVSADGEAGRENRVYNNIVSDINHNGSTYGLYNTGGAYMQAYHNTISLDNTNATAGATYGFYQLTSVAGIEFKNNIISITRGGSGIKYCIYKSTAATALVSNYNDLYINSGGSGAQSIGYLSGAQATISDWQNASGQDINSVIDNPTFSNASAGNYAPTNSTMNNKGTPVNVLTDILGNARSTTTPDLGAYEFLDPLPVKLISFAATASGKDVVVNWATAGEINLNRFEVERSADGVHFTLAGIVNATGHSTRLQNYSLTDAAALIRTSQLYYRLKTISKDGSVEYSKVVSVKIGMQNTITATVYPTPAISAAYVRVSTPAAGKLSLQVTDQWGRLMSSTQVQVQAGIIVVSIPRIETLSAGTYFVKLALNGTEIISKLVK
jgi:hypothetical protein